MIFSVNLPLLSVPWQDTALKGCAHCFKCIARVDHDRKQYNFRTEEKGDEIQFSTCVGCKLVAYCSQECTTAASGIHKYECPKLLLATKIVDLIPCRLIIRLVSLLEAGFIGMKGEDHLEREFLPAHLLLFRGVEDISEKLDWITQHIIKNKLGTKKYAKRMIAMVKSATLEVKYD